MIGIDSWTVGAAPAPSPTSVDPTTATVNVALSNYFLALGLLVAAVVVIIIALGFALLYHARLLSTITAAVKTNREHLGTTSDDVTKSLDLAPSIVGPDEGSEAGELVFAVRRVDTAQAVTWKAEGATPSSGSGYSFVTTFNKPGDYEIHATLTDSSGTETALQKKVKIGATSSGPAASAIVLPFVIKNWGRLVIIIFGVGVISALMATKILDAAAGIGILGTLLGVGAVTATSGGSGDKPAPPEV